MPSALSRLRFLPCTGDVPGQVFTAPGTIIAVAYNGILLAPNSRYTVAGNLISFTFQLEEGDSVYALCLA